LQIRLHRLAQRPVGDDDAHFSKSNAAAKVFAKRVLRTTAPIS